VDTILLILFSLTLFLSAFLLFWVELMVAKMVLPLLGGSPAVWNTSLFFFQTTLLLAYGYAHITTKWWGTRRQTLIHILVLLLPMAFLPITLTKGWLPPQTDNPTFWLLGLLLLSVGSPFFAVSTTAPLVQKWFAHTNHPNSADPYFLYTASNLGSLLGVIAYPILIEPNLSLSSQSWGWGIGYGLLFLLTLGCGACLWLSKKSNNPQEKAENQVDENIPAPTWQLKTQWILLSFLPSSLLLGVTTYLTTDLAAIPLLWALPLAIYLLTFIFTFARKPIFSEKTIEIGLPLLLSPLIILSLLKIIQPVWLLLPLHLLGLLGIAGVFHGKLAKSRPNPKYLTSFYFWISLGGVLGGLFNAIAAPLLFPNVLEYPLILGLSLLLLGISSAEELKQQAEAKKRAEEAILATLINGDDSGNYTPLHFNSSNLPGSRRSPLILAISIALLFCFLLAGFQVKYFHGNSLGIIFAVGLLLAMRYAFNLHPTRLFISVILIILINQFYLPGMGALLVTERSFFGVNRVLENKSENYHSLLHGTTLHGKQSLDPQRRHEPLTYFSYTSPIGQVFQVLDQRLSHIGVMGLGIGTLAAYAKPGQNWTFYEIDPSVEKLAQNPKYFTFLADAQAEFSIILGDARLSVQKVTNNYYDLLIMDAFSSDSIPTHLVTREAIQLYLTKLAKAGLLAINISNRHLNLEPVLGALANNLGLSTLRQLQWNISQAERELGKSPSHWVLFARERGDFGELTNDSRWQAIAPKPYAPIWTDDFSNIFQVLRIFNPT
jgi:hypothetical protein